MTARPMAPHGDGGGNYVPRRRNPINAPGPFYTEADSCIACCLPEGEAPDLIGFHEGDGPETGCFFKKQPETPEELVRAFRAMYVNCVATLRYAGRDQAILHRLHELGMEGQCDFPLTAVDLSPSAAPASAPTPEALCHIPCDTVTDL